MVRCVAYTKRSAHFKNRGFPRSLLVHVHVSVPDLFSYIHASYHIHRGLRMCLRGGRSKRGGKRVKAAMDASGGKTAAAARCGGVCCGVLRCGAVCCGVLQCVAVCCSVLQCVAISQCVAIFGVLQCSLCVARMS